MTFSVPPEGKLPSNAVFPREWAIFTLWQIGESELHRDYKQWLEIIWPDGGVYLKQPMPIRADKPDWIQMTANIFGFPCGQPGKIVVRTWMESEERILSDVTETFILVIHGVLSDLPGGVQISQ
jgi:hypothetical protein